ncbi:hypothetical protein [Ornithinimicrobium cavernae]|uniref:hypothetical protein n=1 Tax=Ornithinimicrobium cavernae TaxID=2666047 RepID=UPI000D693B64|nr:hypothetical protein [Ornithinimicrobium cavernae]
MDVHVLVTTAGPEQPPAGLPVVVEVRDTSQLDVASTTVSSATTVTGTAEVAAGQPRVADVRLNVPDDVPDASSLTVWARVTSEEHEHVAAGDWITVQAYPVQSGNVTVEVVQV